MHIIFNSLFIGFRKRVRPGSLETLGVTGKIGLSRVVIRLVGAFFSASSGLADRSRFSLGTADSVRDDEDEEYLPIINHGIGLAKPLHLDFPGEIQGTPSLCA